MPNPNLRILITAGPTHEPIDPVGYIGNRSSGRTGYAIAAEAVRRGHIVTLISGPVALDPVKGASHTDVETAMEMRKAVLDAYRASDVVIMAAAVADYRPVEPSDLKIKKSNGELELHLLCNPDILRELGELKETQRLVGFALETHDEEASARRKFEEKNLDLLVLNGPANLGSDEGAHQILSSGGFLGCETRSKTAFAEYLIDLIEGLIPGGI